jgi:nitric oxide reductase NorQ protein
MLTHGPVTVGSEPAESAILDTRNFTDALRGERSCQAGPLATAQQTSYKQLQVEDFRITKEPYYLPIHDEVELFEAAYEQNVPVLLKGPTGSGKTRFVEYMSWRLHRHIGNVDQEGVPLITVACHEDLTASDLVGRYLLEGDDTRWIDGPITRAVKVGAICYLDEIVEARKDTTVLIHPLTDYRRLLPVEKRGELLEAADGFLLVMSYNPGYQSALKDLKHSTRQRFISIEFNYPPRDQEAEIVHIESGVDPAIARDLAKLAEKVRNLKEHGLAEGVSTRLLVYAGKLVAKGISPRRACQTAIAWALTDDIEVQQSIEELVTSIFDE